MISGSGVGVGGGGGGAVNSGEGVGVGDSVPGGSVLGGSVLGVTPGVAVKTGVAGIAVTIGCGVEIGTGPPVVDAIADGAVDGDGVAGLALVQATRPTATRTPRKPSLPVCPGTPVTFTTFGPEINSQTATNRPKLRQREDVDVAVDDGHDRPSHDNDLAVGAHCVRVLGVERRT
jgi:hypothetical protein